MFMLTETWLKSGDADTKIIKDLTPENFEFHHNPRNATNRGGGVAILCNKALSFKMTNLDFRPNSFEFIAGLFPFNSSCIRIVTIYRVPPSTKNKLKPGDFIEEFASLLEIITTLPGELLITGDFNIHWDDKNSFEKLQFDDTLLTFGLKQFVTTSTHISGHILDFIITRHDENNADDDIVKDVEVADMISDHSLLISSLAVEKPRSAKKFKTYRKIRKINIAKFQTDLQQALSLIHDTDSPDELACRMIDALATVLDEHAPTCTRKLPNKSMAPWFNDNIRNAIKKRRKMEKIWRSDRIEIKRQMFKSARNAVCKEIDDAKRKYYNDSIEECEGDQKKLFAIINSLLQRKTDKKLPSGSVAELLKSFSSYFVTKIDIIRQKIISMQGDPLPNSQTLPPCPSMLSKLSPATEKEITEFITKSNNATCDLDPLPTELLKKCLSEIVPSFTKLINLSLSTGIVPSKFKDALIKPLIKKSSLDQEVMSHYRPIANLSYFSKILEKVVAKRLRDYMTKNGLHETLQSAYKTAHSTESALIRIQNDILMDLDDKKGVILVLLDLSAAFDTIDHNVLLNRLRDSLGISGNALAWFSSYLNDRHSSICIDGKTSDKSSASKIGVPQGSVLGPILFTIYTMPLSNIISSYNLNYHFYADDTQLYLSFNPNSAGSFERALSKVEMCVKEIKTWMSMNMLKLNDEKTEVLYIASAHFQKSLPSQALMVDQTAVTRSQSARNIGVVFDDRLTMKDHIASICRTTHFHLRNIGLIRKYLTQHACEILIHSLISSRVDYCNALLANLPSSSLQPLQRVLNTAARIVSLRRKYEHITPVLYDLHWLPVKQRIMFKILLFIFKCVHGTAPSYLCNIIQIRHCEQYLLRSTGKVELDYDSTTTKYGDRTFSVYGPILWNALPSEIRLLVNFNTFKNRIKSHLFTEAYS